MLKRDKAIKVRRNYSEALKRQVVLEFEMGRATGRELMVDYGIHSESSIYKWLKKYGKTRRMVKVVRVIMKSEREKIKELEKAVADLTLRNRANEALIEVYEADTELKKKLSTTQLKKLEDLKAKRAAIQ